MYVLAPEFQKNRSIRFKSSNLAFEGQKVVLPVIAHCSPEYVLARGFQDYSGVFDGCLIPELPFCFASSGNAAHCKTITNKQKHKYFIASDF